MSLKPYKDIEKTLQFIFDKVVNLPTPTTTTFQVMLIQPPVFLFFYGK